MVERYSLPVGSTPDHTIHMYGCVDALGSAFSSFQTHYAISVRTHLDEICYKNSRSLTKVPTTATAKTLITLLPSHNERWPITTIIIFCPPGKEREALIHKIGQDWTGSDLSKTFVVQREAGMDWFAYRFVGARETWQNDNEAWVAALESLKRVLGAIRIPSIRRYRVGCSQVLMRDNNWFVLTHRTMIK